MKTLGDRIAERLSDLQQSQRWLAEKIGVRQPSINAIIKGKAQGTKHIVPLADALGVLPAWLAEGSGPKFAAAPREAILVGEIGAGAAVTRFDEGVVLEGILPPPGVSECLAARVKGDSMYPFEDGWLVFYTEEHRGVPEAAIGKLCAVGLKDGTTLVKKLKRSGKRFRLESWNAPAREDVALEWASPVIDIRPA